ncbi:MAG: GNAT family N-acetyltransferase [Pseudomonadales bacterium]
MTPGERIRAATAADLAAIRRIEAEAFEPSRRSSNRSLRRALVSAFQQILVLDSAGSLAGYLILWPYRHTWRIYNLATDPEQRNQGIAGRLLGAAVDQARAAGARRVVLECRVDPALVRYYERRGFALAERLPDYYAEGEDALRMVLEFEAASR